MILYPSPVADVDISWNNQFVRIQTVRGYLSLYSAGKLLMRLDGQEYVDELIDIISRLTQDKTAGTYALYPTMSLSSSSVP